MKRHVLIGAGASAVLTAFYLGIVTVAESWQHALQQAADLWYWLVPLIAGVGVQAGLFFFIRHRLKRRRAATGAVTASGGISAGSMAACCAHHLADVLPVLGLSGVALFLADYQVFFIAIGIISNLVGISMMLATIQRHGLSERLRSWKFSMDTLRKSVLAAAIPALAAVFFLVSLTIGDSMVEDASTEKPRRKWPSRHNVIMLLCCLVPLAIVAIFWNSVFAGDYLLLAVFLLCPLLHVFMMRGMHGKCDHDKKEL